MASKQYFVCSSANAKVLRPLHFLHHFTRHLFHGSSSSARSHTFFICPTKSSSIMQLLLRGFRNWDFAAQWYSQWNLGVMFHKSLFSRSALLTNFEYTPRGLSTVAMSFFGVDHIQKKLAGVCAEDVLNLRLGRQHILDILVCVRRLEMFPTIKQWQH